MALNQFGAGFNIMAKDNASSVFGSVGKNYNAMTKRAEKSTHSLQRSMGGMAKGAAVAFAGLSIAKPLIAGVKESVLLEKALAEVTTLTDEATFPLQKMRDITEGLATDFGQDAVMQANALYQTISSGFGDVKSASDTMITANQLALGGVTEVSTAVDGLTNVMNTYAAAGVKAGDVSDAMFVAMRAGKTTIGELASQIGRVAPGAEALGIDFEQLLASMSAITTKGINTAQTASGLAAALSNIAKPSKDATEEARRLGVEFSAAAVRQKGFKGFLDSITQSAKFNEDSIVKLFGSVEAFKVMTALTSNEGKKFNEILDQMKNKAGSTEKAVEKMKDTFDFQAKVSEQLNKSILRSIGDTVKDIVAPALKVLNTIKRGINDFLKDIPPGARKAIVGVVSAIGGFITVAGVATVAASALKALGLSVTGLALSFGKAMLFGGPLILLLGGLGVAGFAAFKAFQKNTNGISSSFGEMFEKIKLGWQGAMAIISGEEFSEELQEALNADKALSGFLDGFRIFTERIKSFWDGLVKGFNIGVEKLGSSSAMGRLKSTIQGVIDLFTGKGLENTPDILQKWGISGETAGEKLAKFGEIALVALEKIVDLGKGFMSFISDISAEDITGALSTVKSSFEGLLSVFRSIETVVNVIWNVIQSIGNGIQVIGAFVGELFGGTVTNLGGIGSAFGSFITGDFDASMDKIKELGQNAIRNNFVETGKQIDDFGDIWEDTRDPEAGRQGALQLYKNELKRLIAFRNAETGEGITAETGYNKLGVQGQAILDAQINRLSQIVEKLADRPIQVNIDGEKVAEAVQNSDVNRGTRDLDDASAFGF